jgi:preprotein translocase subunit SecG
MGILSIILIVVFVITCALLILMVVIQDSDSDSLGGVFAGGSGSAFGSRSSNVVIRFTYVLGALFFVCAFSLALLNKSSVGNVEKAAQSAQSGSTTSSSEWWKQSNSSSQPLQGPTNTVQPPAQPAPVPTGK